jgi:predicted ArsR family transcriptional regulator
MTTTTRTQKPTPTTVPSTIESAQAKLVYVYLAHAGQSTVDDLADALDIRKLGLFDVLSTLESHDLVEREGTQTVAVAR